METPYFNGFNFTEMKYREDNIPPGMITFQIESFQIGREIFSKLLKSSGIEELNVTFDIEEVTPPLISSLDEFMPDFKRIISEIEEDLECELPLYDRDFSFVSRDELKPKTKEEADRLVERYGEYMRGGGGGDCTRMDDGTYKLRIGGKDEENTGLFEVIETAGHEYGHTLGQILDEVAEEELKASAFESMVQRHYDGDTRYAKQNPFLNPDKPHDVAKHMLGELLRARIPEGAIISHLMGEPLGKFNPNDYLNFINGA